MITTAETGLEGLIEQLRPTVYLHVKDVVDCIGRDSTREEVCRAMQELRDMVRGLHLLRELELEILEHAYPNLQEWALSIFPQPDQYTIADLARPATIGAWFVAYGSV
jgi:hypothetical protein